MCCISRNTSYFLPSSITTPFLLIKKCYTFRPKHVALHIVMFDGRKYEIFLEVEAGAHYYSKHYSRYALLPQFSFLFRDSNCKTDTKTAMAWALMRAAKLFNTFLGRTPLIMSTLQVNVETGV
jgi:hypothetical protein